MDGGGNGWGMDRENFGELGGTWKRIVRVIRGSVISKLGKREVRLAENRGIQ